jgi:hypothetical protein
MFIYALPPLLRQLAVISWAVLSTVVQCYCLPRVCTYLSMEHFFRSVVSWLSGCGLNFYRREGIFFFFSRHEYTGGWENGKLFCIFWSCGGIVRNANVLDIVGLQVRRLVFNLSLNKKSLKQNLRHNHQD